MKRIQIVCGKVTLKAEVYATPTGKAILAALPIEGRVSRWGDEIYFSIPIHLSEEPDASASVAVGDLGYWPFSNAFCIFFGPTPVSVDEKPHAASPVNVFGRIIGDATRLKTILSGTPVVVHEIEGQSDSVPDVLPRRL
jgi:hypothetical protein